jgi:putative ABC transport system permease protein
MSPRWLKVLHDLWSNKTRTVLVVLSIAVGIFAVGTIAGTQNALSREVMRAYVESRTASAILSSTFDDDFVKAVRRMPELADAQGRREVTVRARIPSGQLRNLLLTAVPNFNDVRLNKFFPDGGAWPPSKREVLIERTAAETLQIAIGGDLTVELPDGRTRTLRVAGFAYDFQAPPPILGGTSYGYIDLDTLEWLGFARSYNRLNILVAADELNPQHIQDVANLVKDRLKKIDRLNVSTRIPTPGKPALDNAMQAILLILGSLAALSLLASGFLIVNTISALMAQQLRQIGMLKAIGARAGQIVRMYLVMVLILGALSLCVALPAGVLGAQWLTHFGASLLNVTIVDASIPAHVIALQAAVGLSVPVLASLAPVLAGTRITVHQAVNSYGVDGGNFGASLIDRAVASLHFLPRPLMLSLRNTFRRKGRLAFTLSALTLGGAIFVGVFCVREALLRTLVDSQRYWNYNIAVVVGRFHPAQQLEMQALSVPGVIRAEAWGNDSAVRIDTAGQESRGFNIIAPPLPTSLINPIVLQGRWLLPTDTDAVVVNTDMLDDHPDLRVGTVMCIKLADRQTDWRVVGIVRGVLTGRNVYMNYPQYAQAVRQVGRATSVMVVTGNGDASGAADAETRMAKALEEHFKRIGVPTSSTTATSAGRAQHEYQYGLLITFLALMALLLAVVGGMGLMSTMSINVLERIREIGVMRAIGASDRAVMGIVIAEGVFIGVLSWGFGVLLAYPIAHYLGQAIGATLLREPIDDTFSPLGAGLWLLNVTVISAVASFVPARRATRLSVREVLTYE